MDRSWMGMDRSSNAFKSGLSSFITFARENAIEYGPDRFKCPCAKCGNIGVQDMHTIIMHLFRKGFMRCYTVWTEHGEVGEIGESSNQGLWA